MSRMLDSKGWSVTSSAMECLADSPFEQGRIDDLEEAAGQIVIWFPGTRTARDLQGFIGEFLSVRDRYQRVLERWKAFDDILRAAGRAIENGHRGDSAPPGWTEESIGTGIDRSLEPAPAWKSDYETPFEEDELEALERANQFISIQQSRDEMRIWTYGREPFGVNRVFCPNGGDEDFVALIGPDFDTHGRGWRVIDALDTCGPFTLEREDGWKIVIGGHA